MAHISARSRATKALALVALAMMSPPAFAASTWLQELETKCNAGKGGDCETLGRQLLGGYVTTADPVKARAMFEKGCALGDDFSCIGLYEVLALGQGGPADPARAKKLEAKACSTGIVGLQVDLESKGLCRK